MGGSAGIGEATAAAFAAASADVIITGRAKQRLDLAVQRIGHPVQVRELDATDRPAVEEFFGSVGTVDHLVLAASPGAVGAGPFAGLDEAALRQAFDGKFFAYVSVLRAALPDRRRGRVIPAAARPRVPRRRVPGRHGGSGPAR